MGMLLTYHDGYASEPKAEKPKPARKKAEPKAEKPND